MTWDADESGFTLETWGKTEYVRTAVYPRYRKFFSSDGAILFELWLHLPTLPFELLGAWESRKTYRMTLIDRAAVSNDIRVLDMPYTYGREASDVVTRSHADALRHPDFIRYRPLFTNEIDFADDKQLGRHIPVLRWTDEAKVENLLTLSPTNEVRHYRGFRLVRQIPVNLCERSFFFTADGKRVYALNAIVADRSSFDGFTQSERHGPAFVRLDLSTGDVRPLGAFVRDRIEGAVSADGVELRVEEDDVPHEWFVLRLDSGKQVREVVLAGQVADGLWHENGQTVLPTALALAALVTDPDTERMQSYARQIVKGARSLASALPADDGLERRFAERVVVAVACRTKDASLKSLVAPHVRAAEERIASVRTGKTPVDLPALAEDLQAVSYGATLGLSDSPSGAAAKELEALVRARPASQDLASRRLVLKLLGADDWRPRTNGGSEFVRWRNFAWQDTRSTLSVLHDRACLAAAKQADKRFAECSYAWDREHDAQFFLIYALNERGRRRSLSKMALLTFVAYAKW